MRVLVWHVHGSWLTAFVQGGHDYVVPVVADRGPDGRGRARTWDWPTSVVERTPEQLALEDVDVVVLQRPEELHLAARWLRRTPGVDVPAVFVEHNTPGGDVPWTRHPLAGRSDIPVVHVTAFNALMWDTGEAPTRLVEHGIPDPGHRWTGERRHVAAAVNDPVRRGRAVGTDLLLDLASAVPLEVCGMRVSELQRLAGDAPGLTLHEDTDQPGWYAVAAACGAYAHTARWTSLGLSLLEAMHLGTPVVALGCTEVPRAVPPGTGLVVASAAELREGVHRLLADPSWARELGHAGRERALDRYGLARFLADWEEVLWDVVKGGRGG